MQGVGKNKIEYKYNAYFTFLLRKIHHVPSRKVKNPSLPPPTLTKSDFYNKILPTPHHRKK